MSVDTMKNKTFSVLQKVVDVRPGETKLLLLGFFYFLLLLSSYYLLRPLRDALGLVSGPGELQWLFTLTFFVMLGLAPLFGWLVRRHQPRRFVTYVYRFFAINILIFCMLMATHTAEHTVARVFFVWVSVYNLFVVSMFWSVLTDCFTPAQGSRLFGFVAAGGTVGTFIGPALAATLAQWLGPIAITLMAAVFLELAVRCCRAMIHVSRASGEYGRNDGISASSRISAPIGGGLLAGATLIFRSRYLQLIVLYMLFHTSTATFLYFEQGRIVSENLVGTAARTQFFAKLDLVVSCITLFLQVFVAGRLMNRFGVTIALIALPVGATLAFGIIGMWPSLLALALMQGIRRAADFSFSRPAREVLFTTLSREEKYKAKNFIDTVVYRGGDAMSGWVSAIFSNVGLRFPTVTLILLPVLVAWVFVACSLGRAQARSSTGAAVPN